MSTKTRILCILQIPFLTWLATWSLLTNQHSNFNATDIHSCILLLLSTCIQAHSLQNCYHHQQEFRSYHILALMFMFPAYLIQLYSHIFYAFATYLDSYIYLLCFLAYMAGYCWYVYCYFASMSTDMKTPTEYNCV